MILFLYLEIWWNSNIVTQKMTQSSKRVCFFRGKLQSYFDYFYDWLFRYFQEDYDKQMNSPEASDDPYVSLILTVSVNDYDKIWLYFYQVRINNANLNDKMDQSSSPGSPSIRSVSPPEASISPMELKPSNLIKPSMSYNSNNSN